MPNVCVLMVHSRHGSETCVYLTAEDRTRKFRACLLEVAQEEWCDLDEGRQEEFADMSKLLDDDHPEYDPDRDLLALTADEVDGLVQVQETNEQDWWEEWDVEFGDGDFRRFLFDNLDAFDVGLITELNARTAARENT